MYTLMHSRAGIKIQWAMKGHVLDIFLSIQLLLPLKTQEDLDQAVLTLGCSSGANGLLRILLKTPKNNHVSLYEMCKVQNLQHFLQTHRAHIILSYRDVALEIDHCIN